MELQELQWFLVLAETEHVTEAATRLGITQPTLSRAIARLERRLGVPLFDRHRKRLHLNRYGELFRSHAIRATTELDSAERRIATLIDPSSGTVRVGFLHSLGQWLIPELMAAYRRTSPGTHFDLRGDAADSVVDDLRQGLNDVAFVSPRPAGDDLEWTPIALERLVLLTPDGHRLARRAKVRPAELAEEDFVALAAHYGLRQVTDRVCAESGFVPRVRMVGTEVSTLHALVAAGLGVALVPELHSPDQAFPPRTVAVRLDADTPVRDIGLVAVKNNLRAPAVLRFYDFARTHVRDRVRTCAG